MKYLFTLCIISFLFISSCKLICVIKNEKSTEQELSECGNDSIIIDSEEFIQVEKAPNVDLAVLQKNVIYPEDARKANVEGQVIVRVLISKNGKPIKAVIQSSDSDLLKQSAKDAVMKTTFTPAIHHGETVCCWVSIPIRYFLK